MKGRLNVAKVIFEFDEAEDRYDINMIVNRYKLMCAVQELSDFHRKIYNGKIYNEEDYIYVKPDGKVATEEDYEQVREEGKFLEGGTLYLKQEFVENELDCIINKVEDLLD